MCTYPDEIRVEFSRNPDVVFALSETWLDESVNDTEIVNGTHRLFRKDRGTRGGVF